MKRPVRRHEVIQPLDQSYRLIPLTQGQNAIVDADDFVTLSNFPWCAAYSKRTQSFYAMRVAPGKRIIYMAREILGCNPTEIGDHISHDTLDNRKGNLRKVTFTESNRNRRLGRANSTGYIGVSFDKLSGKWRAGIKHNKKSFNLGNFDSPQQAARVRDKAAIRYHGEFAVLNFSESS